MSEHDAAHHDPRQPIISDPSELRHTLTVEEVGLALSKAGVPRARRLIIHFCQTGHLDATRVPGPNGDQWLVSPESLPQAIADFKEGEAERARYSAAELSALQIALENDADRFLN